MAEGVSVGKISDPYNLPDITSVRKCLNVAPVRKFADGEDFYTLPVIQDQEKGKAVGDSFDIAVYLDKTYPNSGDRLFPNGVALSAVFNKYVDEAFTKHVILVALGMPFNPKTAEVTKAEFLQRNGLERWKQLSVEGEERTKKIEEYKVGLNDLAAAYKYRPNVETPWLEGGRSSTYADLIAGGWLAMMKFTFKEWEDMKTWHDGLWARIDSELEKFAQTH
ncbi:hypothetical protein PQX77_015422 [Marasmius sp. AFHP31]|nr:hypothetical protein PQX77_015422 [Marasmius sp. AFHP31]